MNDAPVNEDLRQYVYFSISGSPEERLDPQAVTKASGITPTEAWCVGDTRGRGLPAKYDCWRLEPAAPHGANLSFQAEALFQKLRSPNPALLDIASRYEPVLQYVVYVGREPVEFHISRAFLRLIADLHASVDCDLYYPQEPSFAANLCLNCGVKRHCGLADIQDFIGGANEVAEWQARIRLPDVSDLDVQNLLDPGLLHETQRLGYHLDIAYLDSLNMIQLSSNHLPANGGIPAIDPETHLTNFLNDVDTLPALSQLTSDCDLVITLLERGHFQSSTGLGFDTATLERLARLGCSLRVQLRSAPHPDFEPSGICVHCDINVLE